ncbi:uncharacterized protein LY89DRAFT_730202 [Mollisia scopiformis]|uniref:Uncharacterized protein n=1 Tax=Mollisia scopiformis TaxID=149040 RepID=A0A194XNW7_MOLSC|nr:uncharacterized protein LY89DRAFT_730202 [Mollisia scopiformis]KUJ21422.1 hypothetical protein LY89DRAFT_730202 [Mollisia scopiformis]
MNAFPPVPINRIRGGGYVTDVDPWGRTVATNLPPTHVLHFELERLNQKIKTLESEKAEILETTVDLKRKVGELRTRLRTEVPADTRPTNTSLYQRIDTAISTADANILRAILREVCRESEKAANIAASILPSAISPVEERSNLSKASSTRTTSTRRTSVRFQEPPTSASSDLPKTTRRTSARYQPEAPFHPERTTDDAETNEYTRRRRKEKAAESGRHADVVASEFTTPRRSKRRADEAEEDVLGSRKRRLTAPLLCTNCNKEYNASENTRGVCRKHSGHKEVDPNRDHVWCDWDDYVHGRPESYINNPEYAEGFVWSCCGEYSNVKRCTTSKHSNK